MKRWLYWLGALASVLCALYFAKTVAAHWHSIAQTRWNPAVFVAAGLALGLYASTYGVATRAWQLCLRVLGKPMRYADLASALMLSQFAKYLPGNVGHHVGRVALARRAGLPADITLASMLLETFLVLLAGAACSIPAITLLLKIGHARAADLGWASRALILPVGLLAAAIGVLVAIKLRRKLSDSLTRTAGIWVSASLLTQAWLSHCLSFMLGGSALYLLCNALSAPPTGLWGSGWFEVLGIYAAGWILGFLMPGSPAGLGVRELVLLLGLTPLYGEPSATAAAGLLRLVTTAGDGLVFLFAVVLRPKLVAKA